MKQPDKGLRFIDVQLSEIDIPADPESIPDRNVDRGVVPWAMVEYLRRVEEFPVAPTLSWSGPLFRVVQGGRCLWAAKEAGWTNPIRSVLLVDQARIPSNLWRRTQPFAVPPDEDETEPTLRIQVLCFSRHLSEAERTVVECELVHLAAIMRERNLRPFSEVKDLTWTPEGNVLTWRTVTPTNTEDRSGGVEHFEAMTRLRNTAVPLEALNGRRTYV